MVTQSLLIRGERFKVMSRNMSLDVTEEKGSGGERRKVKVVLEKLKAEVKHRDPLKGSGSGSNNWSKPVNFGCVDNFVATSISLGDVPLHKCVIDLCEVIVCKVANVVIFVYGSSCFHRNPEAMFGRLQ